MTGPQILLKMGTTARQNAIVSVSPEFLDHLEPTLTPEQVLLNAPDLNQNDRYMLEQYMLWVTFQPGFFMISESGQLSGLSAQQGTETEYSVGLHLNRSETL